MAWDGPLWMTVVAMTAGLVLTCSLLGLILLAVGSRSPAAIIAVAALVAGSLAGGALILRHYRPMWRDRYTSYRESLKTTAHYAALALEDRGQEYDYSTKEHHPSLGFDAEFHVRSSGFRVGLVRNGDYVTVYVGPMEDWNEREIRWFMYRIDKYLWKKEVDLPDIEDIFFGP